MDMILDWLSLGLRWLHVMAGIAWMGTSFYFNWFDSLVRPTTDSTRRPNNRGTLEEIHGGSFYYHEQYWPDKHPANLQRHSWPAKTTFVTGIFLMATIYWVGASTYLIDKSVMDLSPAMAIAISIGSIALCWAVYRTLCKATNDNRIVLAVMAVVILLASWGYFNVFGARAAFIHVGALMGSMMGLNVWLVIVPNHIAMTSALSNAQDINTHHGYLAKRVSQHNNYYSIPVVFTMVSNHFAFVYNQPLAWLSLWFIVVGGFLIRYAFNIYYRDGKSSQGLLAGIILSFALAIAITTWARPEKVATSTHMLSDTEAMKIVAMRCATCHADHPTQAGFVAPPQGLSLDTLEKVVAAKPKVHNRMVVTRDMPIGNLTQMTEAERESLGAWLAKK